MDADGDFVITWRSFGQDGDGYGVYAQRYNSSGTAQGGEFLVNTSTSGAQQNPSVAMADNGDFVIVWEGLGTGDSDSGIFAQRYNSLGTAQGGQFLVSTYTTGAQYEASIASDADGDFVIAWNGQGTGDGTGVFAKRYNSAGTAQGGEFLVNTYTVNNQVVPSVAMDNDGDFVITWEDAGNDQDGSRAAIFALRYNSSDTALGNEFQVNTYTTQSQSLPSVAMDADGDFVITWYSYGQDGSNHGIFAQRYNASGSVLGSELQINTYTTGSQAAPSVAMDADGDFIIAWMSGAQDGSSYGIYAKRYG